MKPHHLIFAFLTAVVTATALLAQQARTADEIASAGAFDGQMYTNKALGLSILAPGGWTFFPYSRNAELVAKNRASRTLDAANTQILFQTAPSKLLGDEKSAVFSAGIQTLKDPMTSKRYAEVNRDGLSKQAGVILTRDIYETMLGNATFSAFEIAGKTSDKSYRQVYFATVRKKAAVFFVETFYDNKNTFAVEASLRTLKFGK